MDKIHLYIVTLLLLIAYIYVNRYEVLIYNQAPILVRYNKLNGKVEYIRFPKDQVWAEKLIR